MITDPKEFEKIILAEFAKVELADVGLAFELEYAADGDLVAHFVSQDGEERYAGYKMIVALGVPLGFTFVNEDGWRFVPDAQKAVIRKAWDNINVGVCAGVEDDEVTE